MRPQYCHARLPTDRRRITLAIETATMPAVNDVVRALYPAVRDELAREEKEAATSDAIGVADLPLTAMTLTGSGQLAHRQ